MNNVLMYPHNVYIVIINRKMLVVVMVIVPGMSGSGQAWVALCI